MFMLWNGNMKIYVLNYFKLLQENTCSKQFSSTILLKHKIFYLNYNFFETIEITAENKVIVEVFHSL
jgi:hypothetical protein